MFSDFVKRDFGINIGTPPLPDGGEKLMHHTVLSYLYFYTTILASRPLLILQTELTRHATPPRPNTAVANTTTAHPISPISLAAAPDRCIAAAQSTVIFAESLLSTVPGVQGLCNHGYFLETACFVLVLAAAAVGTGVHDRSSHVAYIARGLACLRELVQREPVRSVANALERMLERLRAGMGEQQAAAVGEGQQEERVPGMQFGGSPEERAEMDSGAAGSSETGVWQSGERVAQEDAGMAMEQGVLGGVGLDGLLDDIQWPSGDWGFDVPLLDVGEFVSVMGDQSGLQGFP